MAIIAVSIFSKNGKALLARVFVSDMTRDRLQGLLDAFPRLIDNDKDSAQRQHTFIETTSVRYVFHLLDNIYVTLVTTKASNILEDRETLRLFSSLIPEYCKLNEEKEILASSFDLINAFDEVVTCGHRESVNLAQVKTFTDMDSHEERVFLEIKEAQEKAAKQVAAEKAKEITRQKKEAALNRGINRPSGYSFGSGISSSSTPLTTVSDAPVISKPTAPKSLSGQNIAPVDEMIAENRSVSIAPLPTVKREPVHIRAEEKITASVGRFGGVNTVKISGTLKLYVASPELNSVSVQMKNSAPASMQWEINESLDEDHWISSTLLKLRGNDKVFPVGNDPEESADGWRINVTYKLQCDTLSLKDVTISIPLPKATSPVVALCGGDYDYQNSENQIVWTVPVIDSSNKTGTLEFDVPNGHSDAFFPITVSFWCNKLMANLEVDTVKLNNTSVVFSVESCLSTEKYEIV